jgi:cyanoexosortase A
MITKFKKIEIESYLSNIKMWLFFAAVNFVLWYGVLTHRMKSSDFLITAFFVLTAFFLLWKKRKDIIIYPQTLASILGFLILIWVLLRGTSIFWFEQRFLQFLPLIYFLGLALIISGWKLKLYTRSFLTLFLLSLVGTLKQSIQSFQIGSWNLSELTSQGSAFLLHYLGFNVTHENVYIHLNSGSVEVLYACTGGPIIALLFNLTLGLVLITPISWRLLWKLLLGIFSLGFFLGVIRVALLAVVVSDEAAFDYWHGEQGNQIFSLIAFSIWIIGAHFIYEHYENNQENDHSPTLKKETVEETEYSLPREESVTVFSLTSPRSWLLPIAGVMMTITTVLTILAPQIGRREIPPLQFPLQLSLSDWKQENSISLVTSPETELTHHRLRSGQEYHYQKQQMQVKAALRCISPTFGNIDKYIPETYDKALQEAYQQGNTNYLANIGYYHLFNDEKQAYLSACLTPTFESTVNQRQYVSKANRQVLNWKTLIPRLLGKTNLRERRCLWVTLSTPLNPDSPETSYQILESVFKAGYPKWQGLFENQ